MRRERSWMLLAALGLAIALPLGCDSSSDIVTPPPVVADLVITINDDGMTFSPNPATVQVGQTVSWHNADEIAHSATQDGGAFDTGDVASGTTSTPITMGTAGSFGYHCSYDPNNMVATLNVTH